MNRFLCPWRPRLMLPVVVVAVLLVVVASAAATGITGTATLTGGTLSITPPSSLSWSATLTGTQQYLVDTNSSDQTYDVNDPTGSGAGWHVTAEATAFTCTTASTCQSTTLGSFSTNGSTSSDTSSSAPSVACSSDATGCTVATPSGGVSYPVTIGSTPTSIFSATAGTGLGDNTLSSVGWWLAVPANAEAGTYSSTVTIAVVSGP